MYTETIQNRFGIVKGSTDCIYIKTGRGGTIYGYNNKYVELAGEVNEKYGFTVCVASNPENEESILNEELDLILSEQKEIKRIFYIGISNGALIGAQQGWNNEYIKGMLLINGPLMINWHKTKAGVEKFCNGPVIFAYGTKDPSYPYVEWLSSIKNASYYTVDGADHYFNGMEQVLKKTMYKYIDTCIVDAEDMYYLHII